MKGLFIPEITAEMFRNGCLESVEALMTEGKIYDIDYPLEQEPCKDVLCHTNLKENAELIAKILDADVCGEIFIDKIRAEIESCREDEEPHLCDYRYHRNEGLDMALDIINKYKAESEEE